MNEFAGVEIASTTALERNPKWTKLQTMMVPMVVRIPLPAMTLRRLQALTPGEVIESEWLAAEEVPLFVSDVTLSWCEFAVVNGLLAARLTRLG